MRKIKLSFLLLNLFFSFCLHANENIHRETIQTLKNIPGCYAQVRKLEIVSEDAPWVIHIQDYHCQYELQKNISSILSYLDENLSILNLPVCLEGANGEVDITFFRAVPDDKIRSYVTNHFMKKGKLSGSEYYSINVNPASFLYGVDHPELYNASHRLYGEIIKNTNRIYSYLEYIDEICESISKLYISPHAFDIYLLGITSYQETYSVDEFIAGTKRYWSEIPKSLLPDLLLELDNFFSTLNKIDQDQLLRLQGELNRKIQSADIGLKQHEKLREAVAGFQLGKISYLEYLEELVNIASKNNLFTDEYTSLKDYIESTEQLASFSKEELFSVCDKTYALICDYHLAEQEKQYLFALEKWHAIKKIFRLEASRKNFEKISDSDFSQTLTVFSNFELNSGARRLNHTLYTALKAHYKKAKDFYNSSIARDQHIYFNTVNFMKDNRHEVAVVVAGGFHTYGLERLLKNSDYNYAVIQPFYSEKQINNYKTILLSQQSSDDITFFRENRLSPRIVLANLMADKQLSQQMIKESILLAKVLNLAQSEHMFNRLLSGNNEEPVNFRLQALSVTQDFVENWSNKYKELNPTAEASQIQQIKTLLRDLVSINKAFLYRDHSRIGVNFVGSANSHISMTVSFTEQKRMARYLHDAGAGEISFSSEEKIGPFYLYFQTEDTNHQSDFNFVGLSSENASPAELAEQIKDLKRQCVNNPFNRNLRYRLHKRLIELAKFLRFAAKQEMDAGNKAKSMLLLANAKLYEGNTAKAERLFKAYLEMLTPEDRNLAETYFRKGTVMRGENVSIPITDSDKEPFYDSYGRALMLSLIDQNLTYGTNAPFHVKQRLIAQAKSFKINDKDYLSEIMDSASRLIISDDKKDKLNLSVLTSSGTNAYHKSRLGAKKKSFGAVSDKLAPQKVAKQKTRVTYLYSKETTDPLKTEGKITANEKTGNARSTVPLSPESINALLVNTNHILNVMPILRDYPATDIPVYGQNSSGQKNTDFLTL